MNTESEMQSGAASASSDGLAALQELRDKITTWKQEAWDACDGKYGDRPDGYGLEHWEGRKAVLCELAAFLPDLGIHYIHVSKIEDMIRERLRAN